MEVRCVFVPLGQSVSPRLDPLSPSDYQLPPLGLARSPSMPSSPVNRTFNLALWTLALAFALPLSTLGLTLSVLLRLVRPSPTQTPSLPLLFPTSRGVWKTNRSELDLVV